MKWLKRWTLYSLLFASLGLGVANLKWCSKKEPSLAYRKVLSTPVEDIENTVPNNPSYYLMEGIIKSQNLRYGEIGRLVSQEEIKKDIANLDNLTYKEVIKMVSHPYQAKAVINNYKVRNGISRTVNGPHSFKEIHKNETAIDCSEAAMIAAATLSDDGYPPLILGMHTSEDSKAREAHAVYLYKQKDKFGYISNNAIVEPKFESIQELIKFISNYLKRDFTSYYILDLNKESSSWIEELDKVSLIPLIDLEETN